MTRLASSAAGLLAAAVVGGACAAPVAQAAAPAYLTVMTFNVAHGALAGGDLGRLAGVIRSAHPDVLGLQEVDRSWSRSGGADQAALLGRMLGMHAYYDANLDCSALDEQGDGFCQYGTAILSRYPMVAGSARHYRLPGAPGDEPRGLARMLVDVNGRHVEVLNTHLSFRPPIRARQASFVAGLVRRDPRPFVMTGDFNAQPFYREVAGLRRVLRDGAIAAGHPELRTTALRRPVRIDYVFLPRPPFNGPREPVIALSARVVYTSTVSDHRPLVVRLRVPPVP